MVILNQKKAQIVLITLKLKQFTIYNILNTVNCEPLG